MRRLTGANLFPPFAWASKPASPSAGGMADILQQFRLRGFGFGVSMDKTFNSMS
jgi:hypothetical protein